MAYQSVNEFNEDFKEAWGTDHKSALPFYFYARGLQQGPKHGLTLGLIQILEQPPYNELGSVIKGGGQLFVDDRPRGRNDWRIWLNDCFIMGGIHSHGQFRLVGIDHEVDHDSLVTKDEADDIGNQLDFVKNPGAQFNLKVTQREIIALNTFGYTGGDLDDNGVRTFTVANEDLADDATLVKYMLAVVDVEVALRG